MCLWNLWCALAGVWLAGPAFAEGQELFTDGHGHFTTGQGHFMEGYVGSVAESIGGFGDVTGLVLGVVPSEGEVPVVGAEVFLFLPADNQIIGQGTTDATGVYTINQMPAGEHGLYVTVTGFEDQFAPVLVVADQVAEQDVLLGSAEPCTTCAFQDVTVEAGLVTTLRLRETVTGPGLFLQT